MQTSELVPVTIIPGASARPGAWITGPLAQTIWVPAELKQIMGLDAMTGAIQFEDVEVEGQSCEGQSVRTETTETRTIERRKEYKDDSE